MPTPTTTPDLAAARSLRVRMEDNQIYAATSLDDLRQWACDGRIAPTSELSVDDSPWRPITAFRELAMDWVAILPNGCLYGPVHRSAVEALMADGSLPAETPLFRRSGEDGGSRLAEERKGRAAAEARVAELEASLAAAGQALRAARAESEEAKGSVQARDIEAGAERQEHEAAIARLNAEAVKRDARAKALENRTAELETALERLRGEASEAERKAAEAQRARAAAEERLPALQEEREGARASLASARSDLARARRKADEAQAAMRGFRLRGDSARKLLQQALSALGEEKAAAAGDVQDVEIDADGVASPASAPPNRDLAIDAIEAQARKELRRIRTPFRTDTTPEGGK